MPLYPQTPSSLASFKSRLVLPFWYWLTQVVLEKRPLNGSSSTCSITVYVVFLWVCQNICQNGVVFHIFGAIAINIIMVRSWGGHFLLGLPLYVSVRVYRWPVCIIFTTDRRDYNTGRQWHRRTTSSCYVLPMLYSLCRQGILRCIQPGSCFICH